MHGTNMKIIVILKKLRAFVGLNCNKNSNFNSVLSITFDSFIITATWSVNAYCLKFLRAFVGLNCNKNSNFNYVLSITFDSFIITATWSINAYCLKFLSPNINSKKFRVSLTQLICVFCGYLMFRTSSGYSPVQTACTLRSLQEEHAEGLWARNWISKYLVNEILTSGIYVKLHYDVFLLNPVLSSVSWTSAGALASSFTFPKQNFHYKLSLKKTSSIIHKAMRRLIPQMNSSSYLLSLSLVVFSLF